MTHDFGTLTVLLLSKAMIIAVYSERKATKQYEQMNLYKQYKHRQIRNNLLYRYEKKNAYQVHASRKYLLPTIIHPFDGKISENKTLITESHARVGRPQTS